MEHRETKKLTNELTLTNDKLQKKKQTVQVQKAQIKETKGTLDLAERDLRKLTGKYDDAQKNMKDAEEKLQNIDNVVQKEVHNKKVEFERQREQLEKATADVQTLLDQKTATVERQQNQIKKLENNLKFTQKAGQVLCERLEEMTENFNKTHQKLINSLERNSELLEMFDRGTAE